MRIDTPQNEHVQMSVRMERAAEVLDQGYDAGVGAAAGREPCPVPWHRFAATASFAL